MTPISRYLKIKVSSSYQLARMVIVGEMVFKYLQYREYPEECSDDREGNQIQESC